MSTPKIAIFGNGLTGSSPFEKAAREGRGQLEAMKAHQQMGYEQGVKAERERLATLVQSAKYLKQSYDSDGVSDYMAQYDYGLLESVQNLIESLDECESKK